MGNSATEIASRVSALSAPALEKVQKSDSSVIEDLSFLLDPSKLLSRSDLDNYAISGFDLGQLKEGDVPTADEEALIIGQGGPPARTHEKHNDTIKRLLEDILRKRGEDPSSKEIILRLQAMCRIFEALLRNERRAKDKQKEEAKKQESQCKMPLVSRVGLRFVLKVLLSLVRVVGATSPEIFSVVVAEASAILADLPPLSLATDDLSVTEAIDEVSKYFDSVLRGEIVGVSEDQQLASLSPLFGLALATGSLSSVLSVCSKLFHVESSTKVEELLKSFFVFILNLKNIPSGDSDSVN